MRRAIDLALMLALITAGAPVRADDAAALTQLVSGIRSYYGKAKDFKARFEQSTRTKFEPGAAETLKGTLFVKRPGLLRWEYDKAANGPLLVCDGKTLYQYDAFDNAVEVIKDFESNDLTAALSFLWGKGDLASEFNIERYAGEKTYGAKGDRVLRLTPKTLPSQFKELILVVAPDTSEVRESAWTDGYGGENHLKFREASIDNKLADTLFRFKIPKGADVTERSGAAP